MWVAALRRLGVLVAVAAAATAVGAALIGLVAGSSLERAVSLGFYGVGSFFLVVGFFVGNRGPARLKSEAAGFSMLPFFGDRRVRWATAEEHEETINMSAVWVALGLVLIVFAIVVDSRHELF